MSTFTLIASMKRLKAKEEAMKKNEGFVCRVCGKEYKTQKGLDNHIKSKHGECDVNDTR